jgi:hypothetical protein
MHCPELTGKGTAPKDTACTVQHITDPEPQDIASTVQQSTGTGTAPHITPCDVQHMGTLLQALNYTACKSTIACTVHQSTSLHVCYCKANHYMKRNVQYSTILVHFCKTMHITASTQTNARQPCVAQNTAGSTVLHRTVPTQNKALHSKIQHYKNDTIHQQSAL